MVIRKLCYSCDIAHFLSELSHKKRLWRSMRRSNIDWVWIILSHRKRFKMFGSVVHGIILGTHETSESVLLTLT